MSLSTATTTRRLVLSSILLVGLAGTGASAHQREAVALPVRDGRTLAADVYLPAVSGRWPVILIQTPYDKRQFVLPLTTGFSGDDLLSSDDYAFVVVDWRGFYGSAAAVVPGYDRGLDGYDAVEWVAAQPWCDGNVGTWGASALGVIQFQTAAKRPPHLRAAVPIVAHMRDSYELYYPGGIWAHNKNSFVAGYFGAGEALRAHPLKDGAWAFVESGGVRAEQIDVPMLHISGWYDHETDLSLAVAADIAANGGAGARGRQKVLVGPWVHGGAGALEQGELSYPAAVGESGREALAFCDHVLRGSANGWDERPYLRYFQINEDRWVGGMTWPPATVTVASRYLTTTGSLDATPPPAGTVAFRSDPADPVPTRFGAILVESATLTRGPGDLATIEARPDVCTFTSPVLAVPLRLAGRPVARLWVAATAVDVDLVVRLTDVTPDGRSLLLVDGARRASLRGSFASRNLLRPGEPVAVTVTLASVAATIPTGHRLRIDVQASSWDMWDVNPQDGSVFSDEQGAVATPADVTLLVGGATPATLDLPLGSGVRPVRRHLPRR